MTAATGSTRTELVYETLRRELLNGQLPPGSKLKMIDLAERFSASQSVVREALTRLAEQGLVVATPQRGFRVRDLSVEDIAQLTEARVEIEALALRLAIRRGDIHWETSVLSTHHVLERTPVAYLGRQPPPSATYTDFRGKPDYSGGIASRSQWKFLLHVPGNRGAAVSVHDGSTVSPCHAIPLVAARPG